MKKYLLAVLFATSASWGFCGSKVTYTAHITRDAEKSADVPTMMKVSTNVLVSTFHLSSEEALEDAVSKGTVSFLAKQGSTSSTYSAKSYGCGYWFTKSGVGCTSTNSNRRVACKYENGYFHIIHYNNAVEEGDSFSFTEMFVYGNDTVQYHFNVTLGTPETVTDDQPEYAETIEHRTDEMDMWQLHPQVKQNDGEWLTQNYIQVMAGDKITFSCADKGENTIYRVRYSDKNSKQLRGYNVNPEYVLTESAAPEHSGYYYCNIMYKDGEGKTHTQTNLRIYVDVQTEPLGTPFSWEGRVPQFSHDWTTDAKYNYGVYEKPTKNLGDVAATDRNGKPVNRVDGDWWTVVWGSNLNASVCGAYDSEEVRKCAENMIQKYDDDFSYIREQMGWPPDLRARNGYRSLVYIFGSGLRNDNTPNTEAGGYQGAIWYSDPATGISANWPCVWASYYPFSRFRDDADKKWNDGDYQREAMIHEGIHAIFADLDACKKSSWFHEAGNTWLQSAMNTERYNVYGEPGFLDACPFVAPFMPIECYSGWLQDGSFGGPSAEGVNMYQSNGQQVCTWRNLLGGTQYGNAFPIILGEICGKGSIPWIWRNCTDYVLKGIGELLGEETMRQLILQYRARMATFDIGGWKKGYRQLMNNNIGTVVKAEWAPYWIDVAPFRLTPYQGLKKNSEDYWMAPDTLTNPGWSGCNIIPIHVDSKANTATIEFLPQDTEMRAQLCYVTQSGTTYYSQPIHCGKTQIDITDRPANNVIFLVVANTDYIYTNDNNQAQRKHHYDYRVRLLDGALAVADLYKKWSLNEQTITDASYDEDAAREERNVALDIQSPQAEDPSSHTYTAGDNGVRLLTGMPKAGHPITVQLANGLSPEDVRVNMLGLSGIIIDNAPLQGNTYTLPSNLPQGLYVIKFTHHGKADTYKVIVK